jgi:serine/threonine protein kinase/tetratricopeptide (TPR) repeat protein
MEGKLLGGRFRVEREVGRGGVGIIYRAHDTISDAPVALKVIGIFGVDASEEARFAREGRVLAGLRHPGIVRVVAFGKLDGGEPYIAMEWLEGEDLAQRQKKRPFALPEALECGAQIAEALDAAHRAGIVHRDVKPSNVFLLRDGATKLVDFGVAAGDDAKITRTGAIIGTPAYMAPEQARGEEHIDARADIYALGATLFEMLVGRPPHVGPTPIAILARLVTTPAPHLYEFLPHVPPALDELLAGMLAVHQEDRPRDAATVAAMLRGILEGLPRDGELEAATQETPSVRASHSSEPPPQSMGSILLNSSLRPGSSGGTRLVTSILATQVPKGDPRARLLAHLRTRGADATELGGDAIVAHLGVRKALGDEAVQAVDLSRKLAMAGASVGIATGRTRIDRARPTGEVVDRAAALSRDAQRGQVLADTTTAELLRGRVQIQLRADGAAVIGAELVSSRDVLATGGAPFVGREAELAQLTAGFERSEEDRLPILASITGPSGLGKTRLVREFLARVSSNPAEPRIIVLGSESFAKGYVLGVVAELVRAVAGVDRSATSVEVLDGLRRAAPDWLVDAQASGLVARLGANEPLGEVQRGSRDALWLALTELLLRVSVRAPMVIAIEDAQWSDTESIAWIEHVLRRAAGRRIFFLMTARPNFWRDHSSRFVGADHIRIDLRPLSQRSVRAIAKSILAAKGQGEAGDALVETIALQAAGSPLFAEELARIAAQGKDAASAPTIEAAIQVQLDALDESARDAASRLAVFGQFGWDLGLTELGSPNAEADLAALAAAEIVVERAQSRFAGAREWAFKHALTRDVAYASLPEDLLQTLHARAGRFLARVGEDDAIVARHLEVGGVPREAANYLERAARRALATNALTQAAVFAERSLAFAEDKPTTFARAMLLDEVHMRLDPRAADRATAIEELNQSVYDAVTEVSAHGAKARYEDARGGDASTTGALESVWRRAKELGVVDERAKSGAALAARLAFAGEMERAEEVCHDLLALADDHDLPEASVEAWQTLAVVRQTRGQVASALEARRAATQAAHDAALLTREATLMVNVGFALTTLGARTESEDAIVSGLQLGEALGAQGVVRHGQMNLLCWCATFDESGRYTEFLEEPRRVADGAAQGGWVPHDRSTLGVLFYRGLELLSLSRTDEAQKLLRIAANSYRATNMLDVVPVALGYLAEAELRGGDAAAAQRTAREACTMLMSGSPSLLNEAPAFLALYRASLQLGQHEHAEQAVRDGLPYLQRRAEALAGTRYAQPFLVELSANAGLIAAARAYQAMPDALSSLMAEESEGGYESDTLHIPPAPTH